MSQVNMTLNAYNGGSLITSFPATASAEGITYVDFPAPITKDSNVTNVTVASISSPNPNNKILYTAGTFTNCNPTTPSPTTSAPTTAAPTTTTTSTTSTSTSTTTTTTSAPIYVYFAEVYDCSLPAPQNCISGNVTKVTADTPGNTLMTGGFYIESVSGPGLGLIYEIKGLTTGPANISVSDFSSYFSCEDACGGYEEPPA